MSHSLLALPDLFIQILQAASY